jgi:hypothetical protein
MGQHNAETMRVIYWYWNFEKKGNDVGIPWYIPVTDDLAKIRSYWESDIQLVRECARGHKLRKVEIPVLGEDE